MDRHEGQHPQGEVRVVPHVQSLDERERDFGFHRGFSETARHHPRGAGAALAELQGPRRTELLRLLPVGGQDGVGVDEAVHRGQHAHEQGLRKALTHLGAPALGRSSALFGDRERLGQMATGRGDEPDTDPAGEENPLVLGAGAGDALAVGVGGSRDLPLHGEGEPEIVEEVGPQPWRQIRPRQRLPALEDDLAPASPEHERVGQPESHDARRLGVELQGEGTVRQRHGLRETGSPCCEAHGAGERLGPAGLFGAHQLDGSEGKLGGGPGRLAGGFCRRPLQDGHRLPVARHGGLEEVGCRFRRWPGPP